MGYLKNSDQMTWDTLDILISAINKQHDKLYKIMAFIGIESITISSPLVDAINFSNRTVQMLIIDRNLIFWRSFVHSE